MAEWATVSLGQLIELVYGAALADGDRSGSGYPVFGSNGIVGYHDQPLVAGPGIVVGRKGSVGALAWSDRDFWPIDTTYFVNTRRGLDLRWVYEAMKLCGLQHLNSSTGVPGLNREDAYERLVQAPPLEEQRRIAEILDTIDETIQATERVIAKHKQIRSSLSDELLSDGSGTTVSEDTESERSWPHEPHQNQPQADNKYLAELRLGDLAESVVDGPFGSALKTEHYVRDAGVRVVRLANLGEGNFLNDDEAFITEDYAKLLSRHDVRSGDILVASLGDDKHRPGRACLYPVEFAPGIVKADCFRVRPSDHTDPKFLKEVLNSKGVITQLRRLAQGVTRDRVNLSQFRSIILQVPPLEEQRRIAKIFETVDEAIEADEEQLSKLRELRSGLAADLLSGRVWTVVT